MKHSQLLQLGASERTLDRPASANLSPWACFFPAPYLPCSIPPPSAARPRRQHPNIHTCASNRDAGNSGSSGRVGQGDVENEPLASPTYQVMDSSTGEFKRTKKTPGKPELVLSWAGAGVFFFWQLGAMKYLSERYDMSKLPMVGASGGALAAVLATCGVDTDRIIQHAYSLSEKYGLKERPLGLLGSLGPIVEEWLHDLLPDNAHKLCSGRVTIVLTELPSMRQIGVSDFNSKQDVIDACMASTHIPLVLDGKLVRNFRNKACMDGSVPDFFAGNCELLTQKGGAIVFDYFDDSLLERRGRLDMIEMKTYDQVQQMYSLGYNYAHKLHEEGKFDDFELEEVLLTETGHMQEVQSSFKQRGGQ